MKFARRQLKCEVPSMAMGDIAFNLFIFFVILAKAQDDSHLKWLPASTPQVENVGQAKVSVVVDVAGRLYLNGQELAQSQLRAAIERELGPAPAGQRVVLLKIHKSATASRFEPIIEAVSQAGGELVHVLEEKKPGAAP